MMDKDDIQTRSVCGPSAITLNFRNIAKNIVGKRGFANADLILLWKEIIGSELAAGVWASKISYPKGKTNDGTLHLKVAAGGYALLVEHRQKMIIDRVNTFLGYPAVSHIKMTQSAKTPILEKYEQKEPPVLTAEEQKKLEDMVSGIEDENLRKTVFNMGRYIFKK